MAPCIYTHKLKELRMAMGCARAFHARQCHHLERAHVRANGLSAQSNCTADVLVLGAGAAGLTAAYFAALSGSRQVLVLERMSEAGKKILMSGGSRCNILPAEVDLHEDFFTDSPFSCLRAIFSSWGVWPCWSWLCDADHIGLQLELEEETQKWFPAAHSAKVVRDRLVEACIARGVIILYDAQVDSLQAYPPDASAQSSRWSASTKQGLCVAARSVVLATGGLSFPAIGTDGAGHALAKDLGVQMVEPYPALTPLTGVHPGNEKLAGLSLNVRATASVTRHGKTANRSGFLFTHRGFSGPSILDLSHYVVRSSRRNNPHRSGIRVNWTGECENDWRTRLSTKDAQARQVQQVLRDYLPQRLATALGKELGIGDKNCANLSKLERTDLLNALLHYDLHYTGHQGYKKAEVTGGGIRLDEVETKTLEIKGLPGLHACGEIMDVFGRIGGFNFFWAWVSGRVAGLGAAGTDWKKFKV